MSRSPHDDLPPIPPPAPTRVEAACVEAAEQPLLRLRGRAAGGSPRRGGWGHAGPLIAVALLAAFAMAILVIGGLLLAMTQLRPGLVEAIVRAALRPAADQRAADQSREPFETDEETGGEFERDAGESLPIDRGAPADSVRERSWQRPPRRPLQRNLPRNAGSAEEPEDEGRAPLQPPTARAAAPGAPLPAAGLSNSGPPAGMEGMPGAERPGRPGVVPSAGRSGGFSPQPAGPRPDDEAAAVAAALEGQIRAVAFRSDLAATDERDLAVVDAAEPLGRMEVVLPQPYRVTKEAAAGGDGLWTLHSARGRPFATVALRSLPPVAGRRPRVRLAWTWLVPPGERAACAAIPVLFRLRAAPRRGSHAIWLEPTPFLTQLSSVENRDSLLTLLGDGSGAIPHGPLPRCEGGVRIVTADGLPEPLKIIRAEGPREQFRLVYRAGFGEPGFEVGLQVRSEEGAIRLSCQPVADMLSDAPERPLGKRGLFDRFVNVLDRPPADADSPNALIDQLIPPRHAANPREQAVQRRERDEVERKIERWSLRHWVADPEGFNFFVRENVREESPQSADWRAFLLPRSPQGRSGADPGAICLDRGLMREFLSGQERPTFFHDVLQFLVRVDESMAVAAVVGTERERFEGIHLAACLRIGLEAEWTVADPDAPGGTIRHVTPWARIDPGEPLGDR